jgi:hypothetical protein
MMSEQSPEGQMPQGGHLYMRTNEARNRVIHYLRAPDGQITEAERHLTGGAGAGNFNYLTDLGGIVVEGANSVVLTPDNRFLLAANVGDNSVSSFSVADDGSLRPLDIKRTGNIVSGRSGTAKSLVYAASTGTLYVLHTDGPRHIRLMSVSDDGMLTARLTVTAQRRLTSPSGSPLCSRSPRTRSSCSLAPGSMRCPPGSRTAARSCGFSGTAGRT